MENLRNRTGARPVSNKNETSYMSQKILENNFVAMCKSKVILTVNKTSISWDMYNRFE